jgi:hypothetical protein
MNNDICELSLEELEQASGGDMLNMAIDAAEKSMQALGARLVEAVHMPVTQPIHLGF